MVTFLLNDTLHHVHEIDPNISVLDYLRNHLHRTGTKEGCASGDCGACTTVIAELIDEDKLVYKSINACMTLLPTLHGKQLITIENLKHNKQLHSVQQAMVDCDGSQCGFCTPGFVMSLFAYYKNYSQPSLSGIKEALGGNLCRCTGYRPIIDAAIKMYEKTTPDQFLKQEHRSINTLRGITADAIKLKFTSKSGGSQKKLYFSPSNIDELVDVLQEYPNARLLAGATDISLEFTQWLKDIEVLVYTGRVAEMLTVEESDDRLILGGAVTYSQCSAFLIAIFPDLEELIARLGSLQIRNQGTVGGNIANASPIGDMPPVLIALGASLLLRCGINTRVVSVQAFFVSYKTTLLQPMEFIEKIIIPKPQDHYNFRVYKISKRLEDDISTICGAFNLKIVNGKVESAIIAFGGMAEIPKRASHCEQALLGRYWSETTIQVAMKAILNDFNPIDDFRASAEYRLQMSQNLLLRLYWDLDDKFNQVRAPFYA